MMLMGLDVGELMRRRRRREADGTGGLLFCRALFGLGHAAVEWNDLLVGQFVKLERLRIVGQLHFVPPLGARAILRMRLQPKFISEVYQAFHTKELHIVRCDIAHEALKCLIHA